MTRSGGARCGTRLIPCGYVRIVCTLSTSRTPFGRNGTENCASDVYVTQRYTTLLGVTLQNRIQFRDFHDVRASPCETDAEIGLSVARNHRKHTPSPPSTLTGRGPNLRYTQALHESVLAGRPAQTKGDYIVMGNLRLQDSGMTC